MTVATLLRDDLARATEDRLDVLDRLVLDGVAGRAEELDRPHAGAVVPSHRVRVILEDEALTLEWRNELEAMRLRLRAVRCGLAAAASQFGHLTGQHGLFALLSLSSEEIMTLRRDHGVYMAGSGRINLAGLNEATIPIFVDALEESRHSKAPALLEA